MRHDARPLAASALGFPAPALQPVYLLVEGIWEGLCPRLEVLGDKFLRGRCQRVLRSDFLIVRRFIHRRNNSHGGQPTNEPVGVGDDVLLGWAKCPGIPRIKNRAIDVDQ